ncbi:hypothetical protein FOZ63_009823, partial [Perkinsus olseni]
LRSALVDLPGAPPNHVRRCSRPEAVYNPRRGDAVARGNWTHAGGRLDRHGLQGRATR